MKGTPCQLLSMGLEIFRFGVWCGGQWRTKHYTDAGLDGGKHRVVPSRKRNWREADSKQTLKSTVNYLKEQHFSKSPQSPTIYTSTSATLWLVLFTEENSARNIIWLNKSLQLIFVWKDFVFQWKDQVGLRESYPQLFVSSSSDTLKRSLTHTHAQHMMQIYTSRRRCVHVQCMPTLSRESDLMRLNVTPAVAAECCIPGYIPGLPSDIPAQCGGNLQCGGFTGWQTS